jgi:hypothetical protein
VREFLRGAPPRGRVFLLSDFWQEEAEISAALQRLSASGFDLAVVLILATEELAAPAPGEWRFWAAEEPGDIELAVTPAAAASYAGELEAHRAALEGLVRRRGGLYLMARSETPLESVLLQTLRQRRWLS